MSEIDRDDAIASLGLVSRLVFRIDAMAVLGRVNALPQGERGDGAVQTRVDTLVAKGRTIR
ncbi:hypothetical protein HH308_11405 [Gordonia sp. TBRC 11910]|uniref:Uncharacterized protein n=1 Tax=Gordonia asplenii TaxID=2725283 RepID=A0A848L2D9_9ACTN|nr:hypothetical protein [Gordonia asplenii]NMO01818.1 hypothetical protein [Gordonia asplenii]